VQLSILLLTTDRAAAEILSAALMRTGHGVTVVNRPEELARDAARYSLVIIDQVPATTTVGALIADLRHDPATAVVPILAVAQADNLEARIALLEVEQKEREAQLVDPAFAADFATARPVMDAHRLAAEELEERYARWEEVQKLLSEIG